MSIRNAELGGVDYTTPTDRVKPTDLNDTFNNIANDVGLLSEVRWFDLSVTGAITISELRAKGWALQDGTTPASQGITDADITTTRDMSHTFVRASNDGSSGTTGGTTQHSHNLSGSNREGGAAAGTIDPANHLPPFIEFAAFIKVKKLA